MVFRQIRLLPFRRTGAAFRIDGVHPWMEMCDGGTRGGYFRSLDGNVEIGTVGSNTEGHFDFWSGGKLAMRLTKDGKLGIGTTAPLAALSVAGDDFLTGSIYLTPWVPRCTPSTSKRES